ncbi:hypothetical protein [Rhodopirellula europaea]|jgi:hypothetical protein|uniref:Uncharacterized protein n=1 Tax=Rhodopirellula europaea SH398 TaxID=1263868 RepID=M5SET3_9BACT|nr:hypothetical protein [Rhodopirellula europaea]EMI24679.1 hypothetical protein RESH_04726 [Rhodopirellula europaea SH398]
MNEPDFAAQESTVVKETIQHLESFAEENPDELLSHFAFDCNPDFGSILLCLDTQENSIAVAKETEQYTTQIRASRLAYEDEHCIEYAINTIRNQTSGPVVPFNNNTGDFEHQGFADVDFDDWQTYRFSDDYPGEFDGSGEDYLQSKVAIMLSRVVDQLVSCDAFACLNKTQPFLVSVGFHDGTHLVIRIINW